MTVVLIDSNVILDLMITDLAIKNLTARKCGAIRWFGSQISAKDHTRECRATGLGWNTMKYPVSESTERRGLQIFTRLKIVR
jgi:hypothetical protein